MRGVRGLALAAVAALPLSGCIGGGGPRGNARQGGVIRIAYADRPDSLDPALASTPAAQEALWLVYTPPLTYRRTSTELIPGLAQRLPKTSDQGRVYSFTFRKGLRYSNGSPLRASDFKRTVERVRALRSPGAALFSDVVSISADDRTGSVRVRLRRPDSSFPYLLASTYAGLVPRSTPLRSATPPPGIGPYSIDRVRRGGGFLMRRRARFSLHGVPGGNVDAIVVDVVPDRVLATREVIDGRLDYMQAPPPEAFLPELRSKYEDRYAEHATESTLAFVLDARTGAFSDRDVRRGVAYALDVPKLKRLLAGRLAAGCTLLPDGVPGHRTPSSCPYFDPKAHAKLEKARGLVEKAGASGRLVTVRGPEGEAGKRVLGYYVRALREIGFRARLAPADSGAGRRAETWLAERTPQLPHPVSFFALVRADDPLLEVDVERLLLLPLDPSTERAWGRLDARVVDSAYLAPFGSAKRSTFLAERLDFDNCTRFNPMYGNDYSSFCLK